MRTASAVLSMLVLSACNGLVPIPEPSLDGLDPGERARVELGRDLFFDAGLSPAGDTSCASCHDPDLHGADGRATSVGTGGITLRRNAPSTFNAALRGLQFWDGRAATLEAQAVGPLLAPDEMGATPAHIAARVSSAHAERFAAAYPDAQAPDLDHVADALAAYQRVLPSPGRYDRFRSGDAAAFTESERRGFRFFRNNCAFCHDGAGVGGNSLEVLGDQLPWPASRSQDLGRFEVTGDARDRLVFVAPSLRNVAETGPWFHDGSVDTLDEAVRLMGRHQLGQELPEDTVEDVVAFLHTLTAESPPPWAWPRPIGD